MEDEVDEEEEDYRDYESTGRLPKGNGLKLCSMVEMFEKRVL